MQMVLNCWVQLFKYKAPTFLVSDMKDIKYVPETTCSMQEIILIYCLNEAIHVIVRKYIFSKSSLHFLNPCEHHLTKTVI